MKFTLTAECEADNENDAASKFIELIPFLLVNDFEEENGVKAIITTEGAA